MVMVMWLIHLEISKNGGESVTTCGRYTGQQQIPQTVFDRLRNGGGGDVAILVDDGDVDGDADLGNWDVDWRSCEYIFLTHVGIPYENISC